MVIIIIIITNIVIIPILSQYYRILTQSCECVKILQDHSVSIMIFFCFCREGIVTNVGEHFQIFPKNVFVIKRRETRLTERRSVHDWSSRTCTDKFIWIYFVYSYLDFWNKMFCGHFRTYHIYIYILYDISRYRYNLIG